MTKCAKSGADEMPFAGENLICIRNRPKPLSHVGGETVDTATEVGRWRIDTLDAAVRSWETEILNPYVRL